MPPHIPSELKLDSPPYEEDIGDLSPYFALPSSTSSQASSTTINSSFSAYTPTEDDIQLGSPRTIRTPRKDSFSVHLPSPSSPSLSKFPSVPRQLSRSQTLPRKQPQRQIQTEISALAVEPVSVAKMHRWIMGIAVGWWCPLLLVWVVNHSQSSLTWTLVLSWMEFIHLWCSSQQSQKRCEYFTCLCKWDYCRWRKAMFLFVS